MELFQKVIDKNSEEQLFIDSILTSFCVRDTIFMSEDSSLRSSPYIDSLKIDSITFDSLSLDSFRIEKVKIDSIKIDSTFRNESIKLDSIVEHELIPETE